MADHKQQHTKKTFLTETFLGNVTKWEYIVTYYFHDIYLINFSMNFIVVIWYS